MSDGERRHTEQNHRGFRVRTQQDLVKHAVRWPSHHFGTCNVAKQCVSIHLISLAQGPGPQFSSFHLIFTIFPDLKLVSGQQPFSPAVKMTQRHLVVMNSAWTPATSQTKSRSNKTPNFYDSSTVWSSQDSACCLPELNLPLHDVTKIKRWWTEKKQWKDLSGERSPRDYTNAKDCTSMTSILSTHSRCVKILAECSIKMIRNKA